MLFRKLGFAIEIPSANQILGKMMAEQEERLNECVHSLLDGVCRYCGSTTEEIREFEEENL